VEAAHQIKYARKSSVLANILAVRMKQPPSDILVVGCGTGLEAGIIARTFSANTVGIDLGGQLEFDHEGSAPAALMIMDARDLKFPDNAFDLVYSFHAIEHIPDPEQALREMSRVLRPGGTYFIGTPNKRRILGYVGASQPLKNKIIWNVHDLMMRLTGRWSNAKGAHAGFGEAELLSMCECAFEGKALALSDDYYLQLYRSKATLIRWLIRTGARKFVYPCVYVTGQKLAWTSVAGGWNVAN
jgi:SAM-dependent methyltransferase